MVPLPALFSQIPVAPLGPVPDVDVSGVALDSRKVSPGDVFVALVGEQADGHDFIGRAAANGAVAAVGTRPGPDQAMTIPYVPVQDGRRALAYLSAALHGFPARRLTVIGVTGTDGKTTTSSLIYEILRAAGQEAGLITTLSARIGEEALDTGFHVTTPEAPDTQRYLSQMVTAGLSHVVIEATSHGLAQGRLEACDFDLGVVTNITHEHLDYHGSPAAYREAKSLLFSGLGLTPDKPHGPPRAAVLNRADSSYSLLAERARVRQLTYGNHPQAQVRAEAIRAGIEGLSFDAVGPDFRLPVSSGLVGEYNVENCLAAIATTVLGLGLDPEAAGRGIASLKGIPGRMERLDLGQPFTALVDFAHTPNALERALRTAHQLTSGRVIAVFGSAGLRDREKRRLMAETSARLAGLTILTAEDPRTESLEEILAEMASGAEAAGGLEGTSFWRVPDRGQALRLAVRLAQPGDVVIACGKGHEQSMCFGTTEYAWDDRQALLAALSELLSRNDGPAMPYLPTQG